MHVNRLHQIEKACPRDYHALPDIDQKFESLHEF